MEEGGLFTPRDQFLFSYRLFFFLMLLTILYFFFSLSDLLFMIQSLGLLTEKEISEGDENLCFKHFKVSLKTALEFFFFIS